MIEVIRGDITKISADAIVNAANSTLLGGGGVDGAIHRVGGRAILEECMEIRAEQGECPAGEAVLTNAGNLPARYVIHTVGPVWKGGGAGEAGLLASAYRNSLRLAERHGARSIAFPNISTGAYGYPKEPAADIALRETRLFLQTHPDAFDRVVFVCFNEENYQCYLQRLLVDQG